LEQSIAAVLNNKELSNRQKRKMVRKMRQKSWKYSKPSPFGNKTTTTKRTTFLLPVQGNVGSGENVADDERSLSLERSPAMQSPLEDVRSGMSDIDLKEDGDDLVKLVRKLRSDLAKVTAERDGLMKTCRVLTEDVESLRKEKEDNVKLKALLANMVAGKGISAK